MYRCSVSRQKLEGHRYSQMETRWKSILCNSLMNIYLPSQARCLKNTFLVMFWTLLLGHLLFVVCPLETAHCAYSGVTAFSTQQSHQCGTLANGKVGLITPITIGLNLYLDFLHIGHEHPYGIKMSAVPATGLLQQGLEDCTSASALQEAFLEGPQEIQDQLILKPKHSARNEARNQQEKGEPLPFLQVASLGSCFYSWKQTLDVQPVLHVGLEGSIGRHQFHPESSPEKPQRSEIKTQFTYRKTFFFFFKFL